MIPTASSPQLRDSVPQNTEEAHHSHHHGPHPPGFSTSHVQPPLRNPIHQERPRRPIPTGINNRPHHNNDHRSHQHLPTVPESLTPDGSHNHEHDHSNVLPPPPPPIPVIVDQLHRDIPIPGNLKLHSLIGLYIRKMFILISSIDLTFRFFYLHCRYPLRPTPLARKPPSSTSTNKYSQYSTAAKSIA